MSGKRTMFFLGMADLQRLAEDMVDVGAIQFTLTGMFPHPGLKTVSRLATVDGLGTAATGRSILEPAFLVTRSGTPVNVRRVPQRDATIKYAVDQLENPDTVVLRLGGEFERRVVVAGELSTVSNTPVAAALFKSIHRVIVGRSRAVKGVRVGEAAAELWRAGYRLTDDCRSPQDFDLKA